MYNEIGDIGYAIYTREMVSKQLQTFFFIMFTDFFCQFYFVLKIEAFLITLLIFE